MAKNFNLLRQQMLKECENLTKEWMLCSECGSALNPVFGDIPDHQPENALGVTFNGGYGMYFDGRDLDIFLCTPCADVLFSHMPGVNKKFLEHKNKVRDAF